MQRIGSRAQVMHGNAKQTGGGLKKKDLKYNKQGKIVSKKMSAMAKKEKRLQKAGYITTKGVFGVKKVDNYKSNKNMKGGGQCGSKQCPPHKNSRLQNLPYELRGITASFLDTENKRKLSNALKNENTSIMSLQHGETNTTTFNKETIENLLKSKLKLPSKIKKVIINNITNEQTITKIINKLSVSVIDIKFNKCYDLSDESIKKLAENCKSITSINLNSCSKLTSKAIIDLSNNCTAITSIDLTYCFNLKDNAIKKLAENCNGITSINLSHCRNLTDEAIKKLAENCNGITSINLSYCSNLTDEAIKKLAQNCNGITSINLSYCSNLKNEAIDELAENCKGITSINLYQCNEITYDIETLTDKFKNIKLPNSYLEGNY